MPELYRIQPASQTPVEGHSRIVSLPILLLNVHSRCNCRCVMCDIWKRNDELTLHASDLEWHRESILKLGVKHVVLTGGEPLLNRELDLICRFFRELGIRTTLLTTGLLLCRRAEAVAENFSDVIISIDGPSEIHDRIRRVRGSFAAIQKGIAAVRRIRQDLPISCRTTVQKLNHNHLHSTVAAAKSLELDSISFLAADVSSEAFNRHERWSKERQTEISLTREELNALDEEIEHVITACRDDIRSGFIAESVPKLRRISDRFRERLEGTQPKSPLCNAPWVSAVIDVDGAVRPCFFHPAIGSINHHTLEETLNSAAGLSFRSTLDVATNPTCQRCVCSLNYRN